MLPLSHRVPILALLPCLRENRTCVGTGPACTQSRRRSDSVPPRSCCKARFRTHPP
ncbi:hypothetical protein PICMEDRAFT_145744 [Pichia membranifaciens NRRL Y-2026]|uniref:Uncharacterized protein n=1 Tax=Pichia membranifaciens NRRL Y-2026 TaxID=763406 RepID=A0A1E3NI50_9ASCO|nr:hypothetical protein PICMEDRAFT_145744 [Pichia membranifaciens NRRL Y-2026]ODQ45809.1 hypothetical protein PICMEDRAFT_145744 [Pichia membranifaciens NRRL Y-2026]